MEMTLRYRRALPILADRVPREAVAFAMRRVGDWLFLLSPRRRRELAQRARERAVSPDRWLTPGERAAVAAMSALIVPSDAGVPGASEIDVLGPSVVDLLDRWIRTAPSKQTTYARGLVAFDELAQRRAGVAFAQLSVSAQAELFGRVSQSHAPLRSHAIAAKIHKKLQLLRRMVDGSAAANELVPAIIDDVFSAFYTSPVSWVWLGYDGPPMPEGYADLEAPRPARRRHEIPRLEETADTLRARPPAPAVQLASKTDPVDVIVIGSGAGGAVVAKELAEAGLRVVILEAGRRYDPYKDYPTDRPDFELLGKRVFDPGDPRRDLYTTDGGRFFALSRAKGVGGSTLKYLAMSPRLHESDFRVRSEDGVAEDWPIGYAELEPYYARVEHELGVAGPSGSDANPFDPPRSGPFPTPPHPFNLASQAIARGARKLGLHFVREPLAMPSRDWRGRPACAGAGTCHMGCAISAKSSMDVTYIPKAEATGRVDIRTESTAFRIVLRADGRARGVLYLDRNGQEHSVEGRAVVVAGNAVETPRLLLMSATARHPDGLANSSGLVGKNFFEHLAVFAEGTFSERLDPWRGTPTGGIIQDYYATNPANSFARGWTILVSSRSHWPLTVATRLPGWGAEHKRRVQTYFGHSVCLVSIGEQLPDPANRVELDPTKTDSFGLPVPHLTNLAGANDRDMITAIRNSLRTVLDAAGATAIDGGERVPGMSSHYLGTCRMGSDPSRSVVDPWGRTHDVPNLFIADGSVFVTGGAVNPALTISALAARTAAGIVRAFEEQRL